MRPALALVVLLAAGCVTPPDDALSAATEVAPGVTRLDGATEAPTLASAPRWQTGEWWRIRVEDRFTGATTEVVRVVVGERDGKYLVGMPAEAWNGLLLTLHIPGFTEFAVEDLSAEVHDATFKPLDFPLEDGATWETGWHQRLTPNSGLTASVSVRSPTVADVTLAGPGGNFQITYDAELRTIARFDFEGYGAYEVVEHGFGYAGRVRVAEGQDVVLLSQRVAGALAGGAQAGAPVEAIDVAEGYTALSATLLAGAVLPEGQQVGAYRVKATAPDGTVEELVVTPADGAGLKARAMEVEDPTGTWQVEHAAGGAGVTLVEGIAYRALEVELHP